ncbi:rod shape-determining protein MreC [Jatrophihabitans sp. YIM 134969]
MSRLSTRQRIAAAALVVAALAFCVLDLAGAPLADAHGGVRGLMGSLYRGTDTVLGPVRRAATGGDTDADLQAQNDDLRRQNAALRQQVADAAAVKGLDALGTTLGVEIHPARVVALAAGQGFEWTVTVSAGSDDGVRVDQTVAAGDALVGRVLHVDRTTSVVLLVADPGGGVGVRLTRSNQLGVVTGRGAAGLTLTPLDPGADVRKGDVLTTGPAGATTFVAGLEVGTVTAVAHKADGSTTATVSPAVSPTSLDVVGIVMTTPVSAQAAAR